MLPLPVGTERVYLTPRTVRAYPVGKWHLSDTENWRSESPEWQSTTWTEQRAIEGGCPVYHVPQPAPADFTTLVPLPPGTVLNFSVDSQPAPKPTLESILGTASAAKAVEQGVADAVEGRTRQVDSLDQLAAEAQAEGEYGTAWKFENCKFVYDGHANVTRCQPPTPRRTAREVAVDDPVVRAIRGLCEDRHLGAYYPNGFVTPIRAWLERNGLSGPVNASVMQTMRDKYGTCDDFPMPPTPIERDREGR